MDGCIIFHVRTMSLFQITRKRPFHLLKFHTPFGPSGTACEQFVVIEESYHTQFGDQLVAREEAFHTPFGWSATDAGFFADLENRTVAGLFVELGIQTTHILRYKHPLIHR